MLTQRFRRTQELLETSTPLVEDRPGLWIRTAINLRQHFTRRVRLSPPAYRRSFRLR